MCVGWEWGWGKIKFIVHRTDYRNSSHKFDSCNIMWLVINYVLLHCEGYEIE